MLNRTIIGKEIARRLQLSQSVGNTAADIVLEMIEAALARGEDVRLRGIGTFAVRQRPARQGHNPRTGEKVAIAASIGVKFRPHSALKAALKAAPELVPMRQVGGERNSPMPQ